MRSRPFTKQILPRRTSTQVRLPKRRLVAERLEDRSLLAVLFEHSASDPVQVLVPSEGDYDDLGFDWTGLAEPFDDSAWTTVSGMPNGVGYDRGSGAYDSAIGLDVESTMYEDSTTLFARAAFDVENATAVGKLTLRLRYDDGFIAWLNGVEVARANVNGAYPLWDARAVAEYEAPSTPVAFDLSEYVTHLSDGPNVLAIRLLNDSPTGDDALLQFTLTGETREGPPLAVDDVAETLEGQAVTINVLANDREGSDPIDPTTVAIATLPQHGTAVVNANGTITYTPNGIYNGPDSFTYTVRDSSGVGQPSTQTLLASNGSVRSLVPANDGIGTTWRGANEPFNDANWTAGFFGVGYDTNTAGFDFNPYINHNVRTSMLNVNTSIYLRSKFSIATPSDLTSLTLRLRYDDGFAAFINGVQVASAFTPIGPLTYNSRTIDETTSGANGDQNAVVFQTFNLTPFLSALQPGVNVLAIHGLNQRLDSSDFLMQPELTAVIDPRGRLSNIATVNVDIASVEYPPIATADSFETNEDETLFAGATSLDLIPGPGQVVWPTAMGGNGHLYQPVRASGGITWREAHDAARAAGGKLATITSAAENAFVYQLISGSQYWTANNDYYGPWLGGFQSGLNGPGLTWNWVTGEPFAYSNWASGEPNGPNDQGQNIFYFTFDPGVPGSTWADHVWDAPLRPNSYVIEWDVAPTARMTLVPEKSVWKYRDNGIAPVTDAQGDAWTEHDYDDASWASGAAELGYGDADEATVIICGPIHPTCNQQNHITTWFRRTFTVTAAERAKWINLYLEFVRDDGIAVYINGTEVARNHLPGTLGDNSITSTTLASLTAGHADEFAFQPPVVLDLGLPAWSNLLRDGENVIAVEVHQDRTTSSDLSFDLHLAATLDSSTGVLANDIELDHQELTAVLVAGTSHGTLDFRSDGSFDYVPTPGFVGIDTFTYRASDGALLSELATVTITVRHLPPTALNDSYATDEDTPLTISAGSGVLVNDSDTQGHTLTATLVTPPMHGSLQLDPSGAFTYLPAANYNGSDSFVYRATDGSIFSPNAVVTISVRAVNDPPIAVNDAFSGGEGQLITVANVFSVVKNISTGVNDSVGARLGDAATDGDYVFGVGSASFVGQPAAVERTPDSIFLTDSASSASAWLMTGNAPEGIYYFDTTVDLTGYVASQAELRGLRYVADNKLVLISINGTTVFSQPVGVAEEFVTWRELGNLGLGAFQAGVNVIRFGVYNAPPLGPINPMGLRLEANVIAPVSGAKQTAALTGGLRHYWPFDETSGNIAEDTAGNHDGTLVNWSAAQTKWTAGRVGGALTFDGANDYVQTAGPIAFDQYTFAFWAKLNVRAGRNPRILGPTDDPRGNGWILQNNDYSRGIGFYYGDAGGNVPAQAPTEPVPGAWEHYAITFDRAGSFATVYRNGVPVAAGSVSRSLPSTGTWIIGHSIISTQELDSWNGLLDEMRIYDRVISAQEVAILYASATVARVGLLANDIDVDGDELSAVIDSQPMHGNLDFDAEGIFTYTPNPGFYGVDSFTYRATDGEALSNPATVTLTVTHTPPHATNNAYAIAEDATLEVPVTSGVLIDDFDTQNHPLMALLVAQPLHGELTLRSDGSFRYVPAPDFYGVDSFTYRASDGVVDSEPATVTITVTPVPDAPRAEHDTFSVPQGQSLVVMPTGGPTTSTLIARNAAWRYRDNIVNGAAYPVDGQGDRWTENDFDDSTWPSGGAILGYDVIDAGPVVTTIGYGGNASNKFRTALFRRSFSVSDANLVQSLSIALLADDGAAVFINGREVLRHNLPGTLGDTSLTTNTLALQSGTEGAYLSFSINPATFPGLLVNGTNTLAVEIHQGAPDSSDLGFDMSLAATLLPDPVAAGVLANDNDPDGDDLAAILMASPTQGTLQFSLNGTFTYTPNAAFAGVDQFTYRATDGQRFSEPTTVRIVVSPPGKLPEDLNADGAVNAGDLAFLMASYSKSSAAKAIEGDLDGDARIDVQDAIRLRNAFTPAPSPPAPSPSAPSPSAPSPSAPAAIVARASDRTLVEAASVNLLRADRRVRRFGDILSGTKPAATDQALAAIVETPSSLTGRRSRLMERVRVR